MESTIKNCQNCKNDFIIEPEDFLFYNRIKVPEPTFCPDCRMTRRMIWRNERSLFKRNCDFTGNSLITMFHPDANVKVYDRDIWWSDKWDPTDYRMDYNFNKPFFEQYKELLTKVPLQNLGNNNCVNSPSVNHALDLKNCYLVYASFASEDTLYSIGASWLKVFLDTYKIQKSERCYEDTLSGSCYEVNFSFGVEQSLNSSFLWECTNCQDCIGCINLRNKRYCIFNEQYTKEEFEKNKNKFDFGSLKF